MKLFKTTVVIWSRRPPYDLELLASDAVRGPAYCSKMDTVPVRYPTQDPDWDGSEFFMEAGDEE